MGLGRNHGVTKMYGIVNATTNFIMSQMEDGLGYQQALDMAIEKGYAENDTTEDWEGWDAVYKMAILARIGMNLDMDCEKLTPVSMDPHWQGKIPVNQSVRQIFYAERKKDGEIAYYVGPLVLDKDSMLCQVKDSFNMIFVESQQSGLRAFYGRGAGGKETASAMYEDLLDILFHRYWFAPASDARCRCIDRDQLVYTGLQASIVGTVETAEGIGVQ